MKKQCPRCNKHETKRNGKRLNKQRYRCKSCGYVFENQRRERSPKLRNEFTLGKQSYAQLAEKYHVSIQTIQNRLDKTPVAIQHLCPGPAIIIMDTSYFGENCGGMVFRDHYRKINLYWKFVKHETLLEYKKGISYLEEQGWKIKGIVCDGKRGLFTAFPGIPVQMCQFHQIQIVTRYITKKPKLEAGKELQEIMGWLTETDRESFTELLRCWHERWKDFLVEKTFDYVTGKWHFTHKRLRSAYRSLKSNLPYLFTWYDNYELDMPNTTNSLESTFSNIANKLGVHAGLKTHRKQLFISHLLASK